MKFQLKHLLILVSACACWLALFQFASNMAILVQVGLIPAVVTILVLSPLRGNFRAGSLIRKGVLLSSFTLMWISLYVLSIGPAVLWAEGSNIDRNLVRRAYGPLLWLHDETFLAKPLEKYGEWWGWY